MTNILFVALEFPPVNTTGNYRNLKFVKYLRNYGINPIVITLDISDGQATFTKNLDNTLLSELPTETVILRAKLKPQILDKFQHKFWKFIRIYFAKEDGITDRISAEFIAEIDEQVKLNIPKAIFVSLPPFSAGKFGVYLANRYKMPLVVDMRDAWAFWGSTPFQTRIHFKRILHAERKIFTKASAVIGVTPQLVSMFQRAHPTIESAKFKVIPNGFDGLKENLFRKIIVKPITDTTVFRIGYVGSFYFNPSTWSEMKKPWWKRSTYKKFYFTPVKEDWLYRTPYFFFKTLAQIFNTRPDLKDRIKFEYIGNAPAWLYEMVNNFGLKDNFIDHGFLPHNQVHDLQKKFNLVLATSEKVSDFEHYCLPSKTFDYITNLTPVIGFVTKGIQNEFITKSGIGLVCDPDNPSECMECLNNFINDGWNSTLNADYLNQFERIELTKSLSTVISTILQHNS